MSTYFVLRLLLPIWIAAVATGEERSQPDSWSLDESSLPCNTSQVKILNASQWDAIYLKITSKPILRDAICSHNHPIAISLGSRERLDSSLCPDHVTTTFVYYDQLMVVTVQRGSDGCSPDAPFSLSVEYQFVRCWDTVEVSSLNAPYSVTALCGSIAITHTSMLLHQELPYHIVDIRAPRTHASVFTISVEVDIKPTGQWTNVPPLCKVLGLYGLYGPFWTKLCKSDFFHLSYRDHGFSVEIGRTTALNGSAARDQLSSTYADLGSYFDEHPDDTLRGAMLSFYNVTINIRFGVHIDARADSRRDPLLPFQFQLQDSFIEVRLLTPSAVPFLDTYLYRVEVTTPPGRRLEARWQPKNNSNISLAFWELGDKYFWEVDFTSQLLLAA